MEVEPQQEVGPLDPVSIRSSLEASAQLFKYFTGRLHSLLLLLVQIYNFESFLQNNPIYMVIFSLVKTTQLRQVLAIKKGKGLMSVFPHVSI